MLRIPLSLSESECGPFLSSSALNIEPKFEQTVILPWRLSVPLRLKALTGSCCPPVMRLGRSGEASHLHIVTRRSLPKMFLSSGSAFKVFRKDSQ